jgi:hypothetical protein
VSEQIEDMKTQAYRVIGSYQENTDQLLQAIELEDWLLASEIAHTLTAGLNQHSRMWMGLAVSEATESREK